jgi:allophanate hydrolase subunit 1
MAKKEKVVDLKPKAEKITEEQLKNVQDIVNSMNRTQIELGSMEVRKHDVLHAMAGMRDKLTVLQQEFEKEYGTYDININDGTINYPKENGEADKKD